MTHYPSRRRMTPEQLAVAKERANLKRRIRRLWAGDSSLSEICDEVGMTEAELRAFAAALGLVERDEPECYLPSPEQIRLATARIRSEWSQTEREARLEAARSVRINEATGDDIDAGGSAPRDRP